MKHVLSILGVLILAGCVVIPSKRVTFNDIKIGMPRDEAVALLGKPSRVSAKGNVEHLYYNESALYIGILGNWQGAERQARIRDALGRRQSGVLR